MSWYPKGTVLQFQGALDLDQIQQLELELYGDPRFDDQIFSIWDLREVTALRIPLNQAKVLAAHDKAASIQAPRIRLVFVATDAFVVSFVEHYIDYCRRMSFNWRFHLADDYAAALDWLGIEAPDAA
ncbi:MAG: hypothetical protein Q7P63_11000 [Verrucomicrobiota bacterium JB022]|nr:hypothetical protein [Verrucomicrobiota bacterium JB022]